MSLLDLWIQDKNQFIDKNVQQIISFAGDGRLRNGNITSIEFRDFLSIQFSFYHDCDASNTYISKGDPQNGT